MLNYKQFDKKFIGSTDIATINIFTNQGLFKMATGVDGSFHAYWINEEDVKIGDHYRLIYGAEDIYYLVVSDEISINIMEEYTDGTVFTPKHLKIYTAGYHGYIFQIVDYTGE